jgi:hypothetical protein
LAPKESTGTPATWVSDAPFFKVPVWLPTELWGVSKVKCTLSSAWAKILMQVARMIDEIRFMVVWILIFIQKYEKLRKSTNNIRKLIQKPLFVVHVNCGMSFRVFL